MDYKFVVGQGVTYSPRGEASGNFIIVRHMPENDDVADPLYKIKSKRESFERIVMECDLGIVFESPQQAARRAYLAKG